jgi:hypothetical protein
MNPICIKVTSEIIIKLCDLSSFSETPLFTRMLYMSRVTTKPTKCFCDKHGSKPACASAQSYQDPCCSLSVSLLATCYRVCKRTARILISLRGCAGWSGSMLVANALCWLCHDAAHILVLCKTFSRVKD